MSARRTTAIARRVLTQLRHDPRTIALLIAVPALLMTILKGVFAGNDPVFQRIGVPLLGLFPLISMFLVTSITMLRERTAGTLERLLTTPLAKADLLAGYGLAFAAAAAVQAGVVSAVAFLVLGLDPAGSPATIIALAIATAVLGTTLGLFVSAFAATEFQAVQFMPAFILPQLLLCGLLAPRDEMAGVLHALSAVLPMTYAYDALARAADGALGAAGRVDVAVVIGATLLALGLGALTLRRQTS
jgi:ABC-2 type transport system permease protein